MAVAAIIESGVLFLAARRKTIPCRLISGVNGITTKSDSKRFILASSSGLIRQYDKSSNSVMTLINKSESGNSIRKSAAPSYFFRKRIKTAVSNTIFPGVRPFTAALLDEHCRIVFSGIAIFKTAVQSLERLPAFTFPPGCFFGGFGFKFFDYAGSPGVVCQGKCLKYRRRLSGGRFGQFTRPPSISGGVHGFWYVLYSQHILDYTSTYFFLQVAFYGFQQFYF
jgi:hypothetical protein